MLYRDYVRTEAPLFTYGFRIPLRVSDIRRVYITPTTYLGR